MCLVEIGPDVDLTTYPFRHLNFVYHLELLDSRKYVYSLLETVVVQPGAVHFKILNLYNSLLFSISDSSRSSFSCSPSRPNSNTPLIDLDLGP